MTFNGPIQSYRHFFLLDKMTSFEVIGNFSYELEWAHSSLSATFLLSKNEPIRNYRQYFS